MDNQEIIFRFMQWAWSHHLTVEVGDEMVAHWEYSAPANRLLRIRLSKGDRHCQQTFKDWQDLATVAKEGYLDQYARELLLPPFSEFLETFKR